MATAEDAVQRLLPVPIKNRGRVPGAEAADDRQKMLSEDNEEDVE